ncbi:jmjC domain-containing protein C-like isoform X2 [Anneissia japonica]|uniref:jmjC domain-containing protein C-like isoform X2 n=1 Tax=Anneissia japonica TaxID=1529436 RepID=UPI001425ABC0|nr:jmjC domain-containing protein C-like isoform X2 [Anneissia japonica]
MLHRSIIRIALICIFTCKCVSSKDHEQTSGSILDSADSKPGHLRPLGSQKQKHPVDVVNHFLSPSEFFANYVYASKPVIFKGVAKTANAFKFWTDAYLANLPESSSTNVDVEFNKKENRTDPSTTMSVKEFFNRYKNEDIYLVTDVPSYLRKDVPIPKSLICKDVLKKLAATVMWISNGGTKSVLHNDDVDNINCLFSGKKEILFIDFKYREYVILDHFEGGYSSVDVDKVDFTKYPGLSQVEFHYAEMTSGDCIFIPYKWFHQVNSYERNIAVNLWWEHDGKILPTPENCGSTVQEMSLADVDMKDEEKVETDDEEELIYEPLQDIMTSVLEGDQFILPSLILFTKIHPRLKDLTWSEECDRLVEKVFLIMDGNSDGILQKDDIAEIESIENEVVFHLSILQDIMLLEIGQQRRKELLQYSEEVKLDRMIKNEL